MLHKPQLGFHQMVTDKLIQWIAHSYFYTWSISFYGSSSFFHVIFFIRDCTVSSHKVWSYSSLLVLLSVTSSLCLQIFHDLTFQQNFHLQNHKLFTIFIKSFRETTSIPSNNKKCSSCKAACLMANIVYINNRTIYKKYLKFTCAIKATSYSSVQKLEFPT